MTASNCTVFVCNDLQPWAWIGEVRGVAGIPGAITQHGTHAAALSAAWGSCSARSPATGRAAPDSTGCGAARLDLAARDKGQSFQPQVNTPLTGASLAGVLRCAAASRRIRGGLTFYPSFIRCPFPCPLFLGSRCTPLFLGSRCTPLFLGSRCTPLFLASRSTPLFLASRCTPLFLASRSTPLFLASRSTPLSPLSRLSLIHSYFTFSHLIQSQAQQKRQRQGLGLLLRACRSRRRRSVLQQDRNTTNSITT